jgi:predicted RNA-binding Zn ribbon-like protein
VPRQIYLDSYSDAGVIVSLQLANELSDECSQPREAVARILSFDPSSMTLFRPQHVKGFITLAVTLRAVLEHLLQSNLAAAAGMLNEMLEKYPAQPCLIQEPSGWRLHHHRADAPLVPMYASICAEALARMISEGLGDRFGHCEAKGCSNLFFDTSKNGTRRFCSTACQSRTKTAAFRLRQQSAGIPSRR